MELSERISKLYVGFNASAAARAHIVTRGTLWALQGAPSRLPFLQVGARRAAAWGGGVWDGAFC